MKAASILFSLADIERAHDSLAAVGCLPLGAVESISVHPFLWNAFQEWYAMHGALVTTVTGNGDPDEMFSAPHPQTLGGHTIKTDVHIPIDEVRVKLKLTDDNKGEA